MDVQSRGSGYGVVDVRHVGGDSELGGAVEASCKAVLSILHSHKGAVSGGKLNRVIHVGLGQPKEEDKAHDKATQNHNIPECCCKQSPHPKHLLHDQVITVTQTVEAVRVAKRRLFVFMW